MTQYDIMALVSVLEFPCVCRGRDRGRGEKHV